VLVATWPIVANYAFRYVAKVSTSSCNDMAFDPRRDTSATWILTTSLTCQRQRGHLPRHHATTWPFRPRRLRWPRGQLWPRHGPAEGHMSIRHVATCSDMAMSLNVTTCQLACRSVLPRGKKFANKKKKVMYSYGP
jgi:hypothetical protein